MSDAMDKMVEAFFESLHPVEREIEPGMVEFGIEAVLAAAPTVEGWVRCEAWDGVAVNGLLSVRRAGHQAPYLHQASCPGPHHTLLLGPEATS
jgi:hypothetical protein